MLDNENCTVLDEVCSRPLGLRRVALREIGSSNVSKHIGHIVLAGAHGRPMALRLTGDIWTPNGFMGGVGVHWKCADLRLVLINSRSVFKR